MKIIGHEKVLQRFSRWIENNRLASTYLFAGPSGVGKRATAMFLAQRLLCQNSGRNPGNAPCGECSDCQQVAAMTHPDLLLVEKPADKNFIPVDLFIGSREKRMREGLCHDIALKPFRGGRRIAIIDDADFLNQEGANCLLKTLEEPPPAAIIFLIAGSEHAQLPTIRSRSQIIRFQPLTTEQVSTVLESSSLLPEGVAPNEVAAAAGGSLQMALQLANLETMEFRQAWLEQLSTLDPGADDFSEIISSFVDAAGKDSAARRSRLRLVAEMAEWFFRNVLVRLCEQSSELDESMQHAVDVAVKSWKVDPVAACHCVERCVEVRRHVAANANQALIIETWLSDLGRLVRGEPVEV